MNTRTLITVGLICALQASVNVIAQEKNFVTNVTKELSVERTHLIVTYDLIWPDTAQLFDVELKIYYGNRIIQPKPEELRGTWGYKITPGSGKIILWNLLPELAGNIDLITPVVIASKSSHSSADFNYQIITRTPPFEVKFNNKSSNSDKFSWEFGDPKSLQGNISELESPVHRFRSAGDYKVGLITANTKNNTGDTIMKTVTLVKNDQITKHKNLRTLWLSSAVASAGIGAYGLVRHNSLFNEWKEKGTSDLQKKYKTYRIIGPAGLVVSGICISQAVAQSKKIREAEKKISMNFSLPGQGFIAGATVTF